MRCAEVQQLLAQGHSRLYFNALVVHRASPYAGEVDSHAEHCPECGEHLIRLLRAGFRQRPGPRHLLHTSSFIRRIRESIRVASVGPIAEEAPIVRIANTIIQQAIEERASEVRLLLESMERPFRPDVAGKPSPRAGPESTDLNSSLRRDIMSCFALLKDESGLRVCVSYKVDDVWHDVMAMPAFIGPDLWARFKSMADLLLTVQEEPQHGRIPIRYENRDYDLLLDTALGELGENLRLTIVPTS